MERILEPEVMDTAEEAIEYDAMDFKEVNAAFAELAIDLAPFQATVLDAGTGTARIPILICQQRPDWQIIAIDLAKSMLEIGEKNVKQAEFGTSPSRTTYFFSRNKTSFKTKWCDFNSRSNSS